MQNSEPIPFAKKMHNLLALKHPKGGEGAKIS